MNSVVHYIEAIFLSLLTQYLTSVRPLPCSVRLTPDISPDLPSDEPSKSNGRDRMRFEANSGTLYIYIYACTLETGMRMSSWAGSVG